MAHIKSLRPRHHEILRLKFLGLSNNEIAIRVGILPPAVSCIINSPLAKAELERMNAAAEAKLVDVPTRERLQTELEQAAVDSVRVNRAILLSADAHPSVRARIGQHFMDRVIFNKNDETEQVSFRDILRSLATIERQMGSNAIPIPAQATSENGNREVA